MPHKQREIMKLKLARISLKAKPKTVELKKIEEMLDEKSIFYFDRDNSHKDMTVLMEHFEEKGFSVYMRALKYGLNEDEYIYEIHIVK